MKNIGRLIVVLAFLAGAFLASLDPTHVDWIAFGPVIVAGCMGIVFVKKAERDEATHSDRLDADARDLEISLANILENLKTLDGRKDKVPTYDMRFEIDKLFREDLMCFADARDSMKPMFGLKAYADIMSSFAAGERYINRVWSASTDGYVDEVLAYVTKAFDQFTDAKAQFDAAKTGSSVTVEVPT